MKVKPLSLFKNFTKFEWFLWVFSLTLVTVAFLLPENKDYLNLASSIIGVTALVFMAKGHYLGLILCIIFSILYAIVSLIFGYYGEAITYGLMTLPMTVIELIAWLKHPYKETEEVEISSLNAKKVVVCLVLTAIVTVAFYFVLSAFATKNLIVSTISVATSFIACAFSFLRSPFYAFCYALNDIVLIILWISASFSSLAYLSVVTCFSVFLLNDGYAFFNWMRMKNKQN